MPIQFSTTYRNAILDQLESTIGATARLQIRTGSPPADCAAADSGSLLCEIALPSDWMNNASNGSKTKLGTWSGTASGTGTAGHFRVKNNAGTVTHIQGTVVQGGGDMSINNASLANGQAVSVDTFTLTAPGA